LCQEKSGRNLVSKIKKEVCEFEPKRQLTEVTKSQSDRKRKTDDGVKIILNGKEIKIPKLNEIKAELNPPEAGPSAYFSGKIPKLGGIKVEVNPPEVGPSSRFEEKRSKTPKLGGIKAEVNPPEVGPSSRFEDNRSRPAADQVRIKKEKVEPGEETYSNGVTPRPANGTYTNVKIKQEKFDDFVAKEAKKEALPVRIKTEVKDVKFETGVVPKREPDRAEQRGGREEKPGLNETKREPETKVDPKVLDFVVNIVKEFLRPFYVKNVIDKDIYKVIMKKSVPKVISHAAAMSSASSTTSTVNKEKVKKLVEAYVERYKRGH